MNCVSEIVAYFVTRPFSRINIHTTQQSVYTEYTEYDVQSSLFTIVKVRLLSFFTPPSPHMNCEVRRQCVPF